MRRTCARIISPCRAMGFGPAMEAITDTDVEADLIDIDDYRPHPPPDHEP